MRICENITNLTYTSLDCGRKLEYPEKTNAYKGKCRLYTERHLADRLTQTRVLLAESRPLQHRAALLFSLSVAHPFFNQTFFSAHCTITIAETITMNTKLYNWKTKAEGTNDTRRDTETLVIWEKHSITQNESFLCFHFIAPHGSTSLTVMPAILGHIFSCHKGHTVMSHIRKKKHILRITCRAHPIENLIENYSWNTHRGTDIYKQLNETHGPKPTMKKGCDNHK